MSGFARDASAYDPKNIAELKNATERVEKVKFMSRPPEYKTEYWISKWLVVMFNQELTQGNMTLSKSFLKGL